MIVGAGLAGISAATKLIESEFDVTILEAEDRIGGRIHSIPMAGGFVDMGAQFCHGEVGNVIYEMVHDHFKFGRSDFYEKEYDFIFSNAQVCDEACTSLGNLLGNITKNVKGTSGSIGELIVNQYQDALKSDEYKNVDNDVAMKMLEFCSKETSAYYSSDSWFDISAVYDIYGQECEGYQLHSWKDVGFKTVFDFITVRLFCDYFVCPVISFKRVMEYL